MTFDTVLGQQPCQSLRLVKDIIKTMRDLNERGATIHRPLYLERNLEFLFSSLIMSGLTFT